MHTHDWKYSKVDRCWRCACGATITEREYKHAYSQHGNMDVDPKAGLDKLAKEGAK